MQCAAPHTMRTLAVISWGKPDKVCGNREPNCGLPNILIDVLSEYAILTNVASHITLALLC
jgi:hypothetical protein